MKEIFSKIDKDQAAKLNRTDMMTFFHALHTNVGGEEYKHMDEISDECFEDVWHEMDYGETGYITWHQVKNFITRSKVHEAELAEERRLAEEERQRQIDEANRIKAEKEAARLAEEERLRREEEEENADE